MSDCVALYAYICTVLPRFEVTLEGPKQLTQEETFIVGKAVAE